MADKYDRLLCFVVNICPEVLRDYFIKLARNDAGTAYTTLTAYLSHRQRDVMQLNNSKKIRNDQYDLLYPSHGTADVRQWDITLLVTLITELFTTTIKPLDIFLMKNEIRGIRNELQHQPNTCNISDGDFDNYWGRLDTAVMTVAKQLYSAAAVANLSKKIENAKCNNLPNLASSLHLWYGEIIKEMKTSIDEAVSNTRETTSMLRNMTVQKPGPSGDKNKRIKTADNILAKLQVSFETTMKELENSFSAPVEMANIRTKLRDNHHVVVTGSYNSLYFETALAAIKEMDYNHKRCVEMHKSSDWRHIDPEDVDLVLCRDPFGSIAYDEGKAKSMADVFNSMLHTTKGNGDKTLDIIIVTDFKILKECKEYHDHEILENDIKVFNETSKTLPADLTLACGGQNVTKTFSPLRQSMRVITDNFLQQYRIPSSQTDKDVFTDARKKFKTKKAVVLTGPTKCGKTSTAVALATSSYEPSHCILLTAPSDFKKIDLENTCLVIIDEFAGQYRYEENDVYKWYRMFDHLYNAVTAGKMNVIVTCEKTKFVKCSNEVSKHPILEHRVELTERRHQIKHEMVHDGSIKKGLQTTTNTGPQSAVKSVAPPSVPSGMNDTQLQKAYAVLGLPYNAEQPSSLQVNTNRAPVNKKAGPKQPNTTTNTGPQSAVNSVGPPAVPSGMHDTQMQKAYAALGLPDNGEQTSGLKANTNRAPVINKGCLIC